VDECTWEEIEALPTPIDRSPIVAAKMVRRQAQCKPCRLVVAIASDGSVKVTGTRDESLRYAVQHAAERAVNGGVDAVLGVAWPWPIRAEDVVVKAKITF